MHRRLLLVAVAVALLAVTAPAASASSPPANAVDGFLRLSQDLPDAQLCASKVAEHFEAWVPYTDYALKDGRFREVGKWTERDTFTANGKTLVGDRYTYDYTAVMSDTNWDANTVVYSYVWFGTLFNVKLPHGPRLVTWGFVDVTQRPAGAPIWTVDRGHNADYQRFCDYFFG